MPQRKRYSKQRRKPRRRRRQMVRYRGMGFDVRAGNRSAPVPMKKKVVFKYAEQVALNPTAGTCAHYLFLANGLYDPNVTGTGHQPMGFDEWMVFYNHFTVIGSRIRVTYNTQSTTGAGGNSVCGIYLNDDQTSSNELTYLMEQRGTAHTSIGTIYDKTSSTLGMNFSAKNFFGRKDIIDESTYSGTTSADPSEKAYYDIFAGGINDLDDPGEIDLIVEIEYIAMLTEPKTIGQS